MNASMKEIMEEVAAEIDRILMLLRSKLHEQGHTQLQVQSRLGWGKSYLSQILTRQKALRVEQLLLVLQVIRVTPAEFFGELYRWPGSHAASQSLAADGAGPFQLEEPAAPAKATVEQEINRLLSLLRMKIRARGFTQQEVQSRLGWGRSYLSQLFGKTKSLRVDQVLSVLRVIGIESRDFFAELYVATEHPLPPSLAPMAATYGHDPELASLRALVHRLLRLLVDKELLTPEEALATEAGTQRVNPR